MTPLRQAYDLLRAHYHDFLIVANERNENESSQVEDPEVVWSGGVAQAFRNLELAQDRVKFMRRSKCEPK
jgi:hypothetical protein